MRLLVDIRMLMPSLPASYLAQLQDGGVPAELIDTLRHQWRDPATVRRDRRPAALRRGAGIRPHALHGHAGPVRPIGGVGDHRRAALVGAFHLKFWDLDDSDDRVSGPIRDLAGELRDTVFSGTLCSEWGGHEWLDDDPTTITRDHLALARRALSGATA